MYDPDNPVYQEDDDYWKYVENTAKSINSGPTVAPLVDYLCPACKSRIRHRTSETYCGKCGRLWESLTAAKKDCEAVSP